MKLDWKKYKLIVRVFANDLGDRGSIPGQVIPKTQKMVLDATLLKTQHYKVWINGAIQGLEWRDSQHLAVVAIEKGAFGSYFTLILWFIFKNNFFFFL